MEEDEGFGEAGEDGEQGEALTPDSFLSKLAGYEETEAVEAGEQAEGAGAEAEAELPTSPQQEQLGYNSMVWVEALFKRFIDAISGRGGVEAVTGYADQIDFIDGLSSLRQSMKKCDMFFQTALSKCNKELLKRALVIREDEVGGLLGYACRECGKQLPNRKITCSCGGRAKLMSVLVGRRMRREEDLRNVTPEVILMDVAYDRLADAYCCAFESFRLVTKKTAEIFGWEDRFHIENPELLNYMDHYFLGRLPGESKIPREEKETLQFLVRGNLVMVDLNVGKKLIRTGISVVKYGYLFEVLGCVGADLKYSEATEEFGKMYDEINKLIRHELYQDREEVRHSETSVRKLVEGVYAPVHMMPSHLWMNGTIANQVVLEPVYRLPIHPKADYGSLQIAYGPIGAGKSFLLAAFATYAVETKHEVIFDVLGDKSNSFTLAFMPLFGYDARTNALVKRLQDELGIQPHGIPTLNLTFLREGEKYPDARTSPPTLCDRIIRVDNPHGFNLDFSAIMDEFKQVVKDFKWVDRDGNAVQYTRPQGIINVRNLDRLNNITNENVDIQITVNLLSSFDAWRKGNLSVPMRVMVDELSYVAPSQVMLYAGDASRSGATVSDFIKESRRDRCSFDTASQRPLEIITDIRDSSTNIFFRDLPSSKDKSKSQIDFILESCTLHDPSVRQVIKDLNNRGLLSKEKYWFWYNRESRSINVIRPCPPTFCLQDPRRTPDQVVKLYEKTTGETVMLSDWSEVKELAASQVHRRESRGKIGLL